MYPKPTLYIDLTLCNTFVQLGVFKTCDCGNKELVLSKVKVPNISPN